MGQQQLLLLVLAAVIVGLAVVTGINMFGQNAIQANQDAIRQDLLKIGSEAQAWYRRPAALGGGGNTFAALGGANGWASLNYPAGANFVNANATYVWSGAGAGQVTLTGTSLQDFNGDGVFMSIAATITPNGIVLGAPTPD
ncbi:MAG: hypothetical protein ONB46_05350 [candidate division KSB1 bacterium]|nr:hypothetical protein [candidate division KSB1 bacterium]MDZ7365468.1 hypothetical protein [candidate division KSB1 bacterium]MDZ7403485.1 hypothetical protein [candidate division KSB1 bacterium]